MLTILTKYNRINLKAINSQYIPIYFDCHCFWVRHQVSFTLNQARGYMKKMILLVALFLLALQVYSLNAGESKKNEDIIVTTTLESGPDISALQLRKIR